MRVLVGTGAWLLGAATATAGSVLAVSLLGQGIADSSSQQLTVAAVNQALANEASESSGASGASRASGAGQVTANPPAPTPSVTRAPQTRPAATPAPQTGVTPPPATPDATWPIPSQSTRAAGGVASASTTPPSAGPTSTVLTSPGGTVLADCVSAGAYLVSWSPTQGYEAGNVVRGPAAIARVTFTSYANSVTMVVSCSAGVPTATSYVQSGGGGGGRDE